MEAAKTLKILSIYAWREPEGWTWNNHFHVGAIDRETLATLDTNRKLLAYMRKHGYLSASSAGKVRVVDSNDYDGVFIKFQDRGTGEPLFVISAIHRYPRNPIQK